MITQKMTLLTFERHFICFGLTSGVLQKECARGPLNCGYYSLNARCEAVFLVVGI